MVATLTGRFRLTAIYFRFVPCSCVPSVASGKAERIRGYLRQRLICPPTPIYRSGF